MFLTAWRNVFRNRRRTTITLFLIVSGTFLIAIMRFVAYGFQQDLVAQAVQLDSGFVEVAAYGWRERPSLERAIEVKPEFLDTLVVEGVFAVSPRIRGGALLNHGEETRFVSILAADPEMEKRITTVQERLQTGTPPRDTPGKRGAMLGYRLARSLGLNPGDQFYLVSSQFDGSIGAIPVVLSGIYDAKDSRLDSSRVYITLKSGRDLFGTEMEGGVNFYSTIALGVESYLSAERIKKRLQTMYPTPFDESGLRPEESEIFDPVILDWKELNPAVMEMVSLGETKMDIYMIFFIISISFGVLNTVQMSIQERLREFGIMIAIGTRSRDLLKMIAYEIALLIIPGVLIGMMLGAATASYYHHNPIELTGGLGDVYRMMGIVPVIRPIVEFGELGLTAIALIVPAFLVSLFSAKRVMRLDPVQVINLI
jgi:ABC-type lipoprotein release transport system permease subunit